MFYLILIILFIAVFAFIGWRIFKTQLAADPSPTGQYRCSICNEYHCDCHKVNKDKE